MDSKNSTKQNIEIHIEELVLDGIPFNERYIVAGNLRRELQQLWNSSDIHWQNNISIEKINAGSFSVKGNAKHIGQNAALKIYNSIVETANKVK